ncbi:MAG: hypothetical protein ACJA15_002036, partial [Flavobacteriales bacterium]
PFLRILNLLKWTAAHFANLLTVECLGYLSALEYK